ncbi:MAG: BMP family ABC transporter substrate-binding protein [Ilumatobacteraceae bacterium]
MLKSRRLFIAVAALAAMVLTACGTSSKSLTTAVARQAATTSPANTSPSRAAAPADAKPLKFLVLMSGPATDGGFYQAMVDALRSAATKDGHITVNVLDNLGTGGDAALDNAVREGASGGEYDLIVAHGFDIVPSVAKFAPQFPKQDFATSLPVQGNPPNVEAYISVFEEIGYVAGFLAAQGTTGNKIGFIGGPGLDFEKSAESGFRQAVTKYAPSAKVTAVYTGGFDDAQLAQEATKQMIDDGIDSIWNQQAAGQSGAYTACATAPKVNCFGNSQFSEAVNPSTVLASSVSDYSILVPDWAARLRAGKWEIGPDMLNLRNGGITLTDATAAGKAKLPSLQKAIDQFKADATAGQIVVAPAS